MRTLIAQGTTATALLLTVCLVPKVYAGVDTSAEVSVERFQWSEYDSSGSRLLREHGPRVGLGLRWDNYARRLDSWRYSALARLTVGTVSYDGQTQSGVPVQTDTQYTGLRGEAMAGYQFNSGVLVQGGAGLDLWRRLIKDTGSVLGYRETYSIIYVKAGIGFLEQVGGGRLLAVVGPKMPVYTSEYVDLRRVGYDPVTLHPGRRPSPFGQIEFIRESGEQPQWRASLYYDSYRFTPSDPATLTAGGATVGQAWQPESRTDVIGATIAWYL